MTESWFKAINDGKIVGTVMVDFRKAFDLVDHDLLLQKLEFFKCSNNSLKLMRSYLSNRSQAISLGGKMSEKRFCFVRSTSWVYIRSTIILIFINDLPLCLTEYVWGFFTDLYADDTTVYHIQKDLPIVIANLQRVLDCLKEWCKRNGMILNTEKRVMLLATRQKRLHIDEFQCIFALT